jgi:uncharacterized protein YutE (UPF0331/DUF86 family)/predicted nucleotidyltransferase
MTDGIGTGTRTGAEPGHVYLPGMSTAPPPFSPRLPLPEGGPAGVLATYFAGRSGLGVAAVYLFGSHAAGRSHRESDVDLGVLLDWAHWPERRERFEARLLLAGELEGVLAPAPPDVVILNDAPPLLGRAVVTAGQRVYLGDAAADRAYVRDVQLRAADLAPFLRRMRQLKLDALARPGPAMSPIVERLVELRRHLDHLHELRPRIAAAETLRRDLSLHNDVLFSLLTVCQLVIDIAGELSVRRGLRFEDYREAVRNLSAYPEVSQAIVSELERLPGFRNVLIHEYVTLDLERAVEALDRLEPVEYFLAAVREIELRDAGPGGPGSSAG